MGITKLLTRSGFKREDFSVAFSLSNVSDIEHFVARKTELLEMHNSLKWRRLPPSSCSSWSRRNRQGTT
jgi:hypothetical protein